MELEPFVGSDHEFFRVLDKRSALQRELKGGHCGRDKFCDLHGFSSLLSLFPYARVKSVLGTDERYKILILVFQNDLDVHVAILDNIRRTFFQWVVDYIFDFEVVPRFCSLNTTRKANGASDRRYHWGAEDEGVVGTCRLTGFDRESNEH